MIKRDDLASYLYKLLACADFEDYAPNGVQIEGAQEIQRLCTAVTASLEVINQAIAMKANALLVHHGYFWKGESPIIKGMKRERIARLLNHDISLYAYHLPLDCHVELGNNATLGHLFNLSNLAQHKIGKTKALLWSGSLENPISAASFASLIQVKLNREPLYISGEKPIQRIAWCSGAAQDLIEEAYHLGVDAYLSGEISERTYYQAKELGLAYFACGHHATERFGIQALGEHLKTKFNLETHFIDSSNPV